MRSRSFVRRLALVVLCSMCLQLAACLECFADLTLGSTETHVIASIKESLANKEEFDASCLLLLVQRGFYKAGTILFEDYFLSNKNEIQDSTMKITASQKRELERFISTIYSVNQSVQQIEPVIKWAQSADNLFLHLKFSMRQDSPACLHCKIEKVEITNTTLFTSSFGIQSHQPLRFLVNLTLFDEIDPSTSTWKEDSVGTLFFNLTKAAPKGIQLGGSEANPISINQEEDDVDQEEQPKQVEQVNENNEVVVTTAGNVKGEVSATVVSSGDGENLEKQTDSASEASVKPVASEAATAAATEKKPSKIWLRLERTERKKDLAIWWDMRDRYKSAMDEWDQLCIKDRENKKKNKNNKTTTAAQQSTSSQKEDL